MKSRHNCSLDTYGMSYSCNGHHQKWNPVEIAAILQKYNFEHTIPFNTAVLEDNRRF